MQRFPGRIPAITQLLLLSVLTVAAFGQTVVPDRIVQQADDAVLTTLKGNVHPLAIARNDLGATPLSQPMNHLQLLLHRSPAQEAALDAFLAAAQVQGSPSYHKWLTPEQFGALYGPSDTDVQKLTAWLAGRGFNVNSVSTGRTTIDFSGTVAQVQDAFHTSIHSYQANGISFVANTSDPSIPAALAPVVSGIFHLNNVPLRPQYLRGAPARHERNGAGFVPFSSSVTASPVSPQLTAGNGSNSNPYTLYVVPGDAATIYNTPNQKLNANFSGTSYDGTGATIGIVGQSAIDPTIVTNYRSLFVGDSKPPVISNLDGVGDVSGDDGESYLDNEISGGLAPGATLHFYTASNTTDNGIDTSAQAAIADNTVDILSVSYGGCELYNGTGGNQFYNNLWQQAAAQGITVVVSTGDTGSAGCDENVDSHGNAVTASTGGLAVNALASTPYDIAVGGTDYDVLDSNSNFSKYVNTASTGVAGTYYRTAKSYIPEATWNNSTTNNTSIAANISFLDTQFPSYASIAGGAGGKSNCSVNTSTDTVAGTCTSGYPKPSWQTGTGVPNDQARDLPDVSLLAANGFYGALWAFCDNTTTTDSSNNPVTLNCALDNTGAFDFNVNGVGGTSASAPAFAGILALVVQKTGQRQGQADPILYSLFNSAPAVFHDVTTGNNSVPCQVTTATTATCVATTNGDDYLTGYNTFTGYDLATGMGSVDATQLVNSWTSASGSLPVANVSATPSATSITTAQPLTFTVNVTPLATGGATPSGTVIATDGVYTSSAVALASGSATITIPAGSLTANAADTFTITYTPTTTGGANASTFVVVAVTQAPTPALAISGASINVVEGASGTSTISVAPSGGFTGAVNLACTVTPPSGAASVPTCSLTPAAVTIAGTAASTATLNIATSATTTAGAYTVTVSGADAATGKVTATASIALTVNAAAVPTLGVSVSPLTIALPATTGTGAITITPGGGFAGAVNLTCAVTTPGGATCAVSPTSVTIAGSAAATATLNVTILSTTVAGAYTVNVTAADVATGKVTATDPVTLTVSGAAAAQTIAFTPAPTAATVTSPGQSGTSTISVTANYVGGKINFGFQLASAPANASTTYNPACSAPALTTANGVATTTATCTTTATTTAAIVHPKSPEKTSRWYEGAGGVALAGILFFGIPARRRGWKTMLSLLVILVTMAGVGCGGGSNDNNGGTPSGTTTGTYTYTVTGTDAATSTVTTTGTITVNVN